MKLASLILLLLAVKTKASFFDAFKGAMSSVENSFGKLLNDVVSDVKTTVHCTILAMEQVLAMNGVGPEPIPNKECYKDDIHINVDIDTKKDNRNSYSEKNIAQHIHSSISKVNESLSHILDNTGHERIEELKRELKHESNRLTEVSLLLRKELEKISRNMRSKFQNVDLNSDKTSLESVRNNMKILYEVEKNDKNASEEIGKVLNEALNVLHINTPREIKSDEEKINVIMKELEQESTNNNISNNTFYCEHSQPKGEHSALQNNLGHKLMPVDTPMNVKNVAIKTIKNVEDVATEAFKNVNDVATKAFMDNGKALKEVSDYITGKTSSFETSISSSEETYAKNDATSLKTNLDNVSSFNFGRTNSEDGIKGIDEAMGILNDAGPTQALLDNFFAKEHGTDAFENPNLLNFEK